MKGAAEKVDGPARSDDVDERGKCGAIYHRSSVYCFFLC